jgi:hypothetical protein
MYRLPDPPTGTNALMARLAVSLKNSANSYERGHKYVLTQYEAILKEEAALKREADDLDTQLKSVNKTDKAAVKRLGERIIQLEDRFKDVRERLGAEKKRAEDAWAAREYHKKRYEDFLKRRAVEQAVSGRGGGRRRTRRKARGSR